MPEDPKSKLALLAVSALAVISLAGIVGGIVVAYLGQPVGAVVTLVVGAISGIVAIVIRDSTGGK